MPLPRIAVLCDLLEENWPSMDLVGEMLLQHLERDHAGSWAAEQVRPEMRRRATRREQRSGDRGQGTDVRGQKSEDRCQSTARPLTSDLLTSDYRPLTSDHRRLTAPLTSVLHNADRFLNRFWDYPRVVRRIRGDFELFHLVDHSYAQLLHQLPPERTVVTCHDLDTFQCLLIPGQERRSVLFKAMMKRTLSGLRKAAFVTCDSVATREELLAHGLVRPERSAVVRNGVHPSCSAEADPLADAEAARLLSAHPPRSRRLGGESLRRQNHRRDAENAEGAQRQAIELLHVGSTIPRKRIDLLLRVFASVKAQFPNARLVRVGGAFTSEQAALAEELKVLDSIAVLPHIERDVLAAMYRRAALVLLPSEREGFGLPVIEALACGTPVVATDLPVLREVGGDAAAYCPLGDVEAWSRTIGELLLEQGEDTAAWAARQQRSVAQAARFSWADYARSMTDIYQEVLQRAYLRDRKDLPQRAQRGIHEITRT